MKTRSRTIPRLHSPPTLPNYLAHHIARSGLKNRELARACGFSKPNIISMIKNGDMRLPLDRLALMAQALSVDTIELFSFWMHEHYGSTWQQLEPLILTVMASPTGDDRKASSKAASRRASR